MGSAITRFSVANSVSSSQLYFPISTRPWYSSASLSIMGLIAWHGPHHVAQKSTSTGRPDSMMEWMFWSVNVCAIVVCFD